MLRAHWLLTQTTGAHTIAHRIKSLGEVWLDTPISEIRASLLDALDLPLNTPAFALVPETATHDVDHSVVELGVEAATFAQVLFVSALEAAVRIEITSKLEKQVKGMTGTGGQDCETLDVWQEFEHAGREAGCWQGVVEIVLKAVEIKVDDGDLAVELRVERSCSMCWVLGATLVHLLSDAWWDV